MADNHDFLDNKMGGEGVRIRRITTHDYRREAVEKVASEMDLEIKFEENTDLENMIDVVFEAPNEVVEEFRRRVEELTRKEKK